MLWKNKSHSTLSFLLLLCGISNHAQQKENLLHHLNNLLIHTVMEDLFSPPVGSRIYVYPNIAFYECIRQDDGAYPPLCGKLNGSQVLPVAGQDNRHFISAAVAFTHVAQSLVASEHVMENWRRQFIDSLLASEDSSAVLSAASYGKQIADSIAIWIAGDNYMKSRGMMRYVNSTERGTWQPTPNDYAQGLEPHWGTLRPLVMKTSSQFSPKQKLKYSTSVKSDFYKNVREVYKIGKTLDSNQKELALYWDDNPNVSVVEGHLNYFVHKISPAGHWMMIAKQACVQKKIPLVRASLVYALTGIALFEGFISCWDEKYRTNLVRPITVINDEIDPDWRPFIQTPPFPEFTSGHSVISNAAAAVLTGLIGDNFAFTDDTEIPFGLRPRKFGSFYDAALESSLSRVYGGIHYPETARISIRQGKAIGKYVLSILYEPLIEKK